MLSLGRKRKMEQAPGNPKRKAKVEKIVVEVKKARTENRRRKNSNKKRKKNKRAPKEVKGEEKENNINSKYQHHDNYDY